MKILSVVVRWILTGLLIYLAFKENGKWTAVCLVLIFLALELFAAITNRRARELRELEAHKHWDGRL